MPAAILAVRLRRRRISENVLNVATATPPGIFLILLVSLKYPEFRFRHIYEMGSRFTAKAQSMYRIGIGYDIHRLVEGRRLILGGVEIPFEKGLLGHSDGDALLHAVADAMLGALSLGDIGGHFPDTDPKYKDADSSRLLGEVVNLVRKSGYHVVNMDANIIAQRPKLTPHIPKMQKRIAGVLGVDVKCIGLKARSNESLDAVGQGQAIAVQTVVLLLENKCH